MAMTTYETRLRGARKRLVEALSHAMEPDERSAIEKALGLINGLLGLTPKPEGGVVYDSFSGTYVPVGD